MSSRWGPPWPMPPGPPLEAGLSRAPPRSVSSTAAIGCAAEVDIAPVRRASACSASAGARWAR
eukprot:11181749-Lingulodinium_polyedra.AAC.1